MQQLSGTDHVSLFSERRAMYNHVAALSIYDVSTAPGGKVRFKDILQHFEQRLYLHPVFRQKLVSVPFGLDRPYWVASGDIDLDGFFARIDKHDTAGELALVQAAGKLAIALNGGAEARIQQRVVQIRHVAARIKLQIGSGSVLAEQI